MGWRVVMLRESAGGTIFGVCDGDDKLCMATCPRSCRVCGQSAKIEGRRMSETKKVRDPLLSLMSSSRITCYSEYTTVFLPSSIVTERRKLYDADRIPRRHDTGGTAEACSSTTEDAALH